MEYKYIVGVDPGKKGAFGIVNKKGEFIEAFDMPLLKPENLIDEKVLVDLLRDLPHRAVVHIEKVNSMPRDGVTSAFSFGYGYGLVVGILRSFKYVIHRTRPAVWKKAYFQPKSTKKDSLALARSKYGKEHFPLEKHDGRAEACLIADYCRIHILGMKDDGKE